MRSSRETAALDAENEKAEAIKAMNALPKDMGATAPSRHATFAREGRSDSATQQAAERASRTTGAKIQKLIRKKEYAQAAATLGGLVRNPQIRPLLAAAGIVLSEDTELGRVIVDNLAAMIAPIARVRTETSKGGSRSADEQRALGFASMLPVSSSPRRKTKGQKRTATMADAAMAASAMGTSAIAFRRLSARLGIDQRTGHRLWNHGLAKRREIKAGAEGAYLIDMTKRIGSRRIQRRGPSRRHDLPR